MTSFIIWLVGALCCIWCIRDLWSKKKVDQLTKLILTLALLVFSWIGLAVYYFILKDNLGKSPKSKASKSKSRSKSKSK